MAGYIGNGFKISGRYTVDEFTSSGGTTYTLGSAPGDKNNMQVSAGGLVQYPSAYSVSGTTLTLTGVPSGQKIVVRHMGDTIPFPLLDDNVVTNAKLADDAVGLAEMASGTDGNIITYDASGNPAAVTTGTAGQVLTSAGAGAPPTFADAGGGGKILQVVSTTKTDTFSHATATFTDVTGLSVTTGTLASTSSKILVTALINGTNPTSYQSMFQLVRTSTAIGIGDAAGSRTRCSANLYGANSDTVHPVVIQFLDSGSFADTSAVVYKIQIKVDSGTPTMYINRSYGDSDSVSKARTVSTITAMEIGA